MLNYDIYINKEINVKDALQKLEQSGKQILFVVEEKKLIGAITDGDIRRFILNNGNLTQTITQVMNKNPKYIKETELNRAKIYMRQNDIKALPVVNSDLNIIDVVFLDKSNNTHFKPVNKLNNKVVIMAGGKGQRLLPYTKIIPKPLIPIGDKTIIELIMERFKVFGMNEFNLTVNYKKNMIKAYFDDIKEENEYIIKYADEDLPLGTAGSLLLLKDELTETFFVSNCDILIKADYEDIYNIHKKNENIITLVTSIKTYNLPYGIVEVSDDGVLNKIHEKPEYHYLVNTGMYILEPDVIKLIPKNKMFHITDLVELCKKNDMKVGIYPIAESSWLDMGELSEMDKMISVLSDGD